jgi:predicted oxidoreductase
MQKQLSPLISGVMNWGIWGKNLNTIGMAKCIETFYSHGISAFDHADIYGDYTTEAAFGYAFKETHLERQHIQLITKCGIQHTKGRSNLVKHYEYSKKYIIWSVEQSLRHLQTDYVDVLLLHRPSPLMVVDEIAEAVMKLRAEGKIIDFGVSNFTSNQTALLRQKVEISYNQIQFSATHFQPMVDGSLDYMQLNKICPMIWNPLGSFFREENEQTLRLKKLLHLLTDKYNVGPEVMLLAWILKHPSGCIPVIGTTDESRITSIVKAMKTELELVDWFSIWTESMGNKVP